MPFFSHAHLLLSLPKVRLDTLLVDSRAVRVENGFLLLPAADGPPDDRAVHLSAARF